MPKAKPITDHTGKVHKSLTELCEYWGICRDTYVSRMRSGKYTMEQALTLPVESNARIVTDHLGNSFENTMKMCDYWGIPLNTYRSRRAVLNWTLEKSLTEPLYMGKTESAVDHLGNSYKSIVDMCKHYKIDYPAYKSRLIRGWTLEEALTIPKHDNKSIKEVLGEIKDHEGVEYGSIKAMCNAWGISEPLFRSRIRRGFTIEQALSDRKYYKTIVDRDTIIDHLGNKFDTVTDMCKYHNISYKTFAKRIQVYGWDLGKALTYKSPVVRKQSEPIKDHLGNEYATIKEMCEKYNIKVSTYAVRINRGATVEDALTKPIQTESTGKPITDHLGNHFPSITEMCKAHNIGVSAFKSRVYIQGWSIEQALTEPLRRNRRKR